MYRQSVEDRDGFWREAAKLIAWERPPGAIFDGKAWFGDGRLNICHNALDRHVHDGRGDQTALIYDSPVTGTKRTYSYSELLSEVERAAGMISAIGVRTGDRVVIYMPMIPEAMFAMLACARIGAIHSVVFGGFAAKELAKRIDDAEPVLVLAASCGIEPGRIVEYKPLLDDALEQSRHKVPRCIILQRPEYHATLIAGRDQDWAEALAQAKAVECVAVSADHPLYILYTSGTTGAPKGVVRDTGGYATALAWSIRNIFGVKAGDTMWTASDVGWVVGHSYIVYAPLLAGATTILYEGKPVGTPDAGAFWRVLREHDVDIFFTAPTAVRAIRKEDPDLTLLGEKPEYLKAIFLAGERADPATLEWLSDRLALPVIDHWWQTETGWPAIATCFGLGRTETLFGSAGHPVPGYAFEILDADGRKLPAGEIGELAIRLPLPPGCLPTLWQNQAGFVQSYLSRHPGYYAVGDAGLIDEDGRLHIMSRIDDIINVAGHRLSTAGIEQIIGAHPAVAECAVVGAADSLKGMLPVALVVRKANAVTDDATLTVELVARVRQELGPVAAFRTVAVVEQLPKTRSGKILRSVIRDLADGHEPKIPATIEAPVAVTMTKAALASVGYPASPR
nr:AMP-binding protein [Sphingobium sp. EM0848]